MINRSPKIEDGHELLNQKKYQEAIGAYSAYLKSKGGKPNLSMCRYYGEAYYGLGEYDKAIDQYKTAIQHCTFNKPYFELGQALFKQGKYQEALEQFQKAEHALLPNFMESNRKAIMMKIHCMQRLAKYKDLMHTQFDSGVDLEIEVAQSRGYFSRPWDDIRDMIPGPTEIYSIQNRYERAIADKKGTSSRIHNAYIKLKQLNPKRYASSLPQYNLPLNTSENLCILALHQLSNNETSSAKKTLQELLTAENLRTLPAYLLVDFIEAYYKLGLQGLEVKEEKGESNQTEETPAQKELALLKNQYLLFATNAAEYHYNFSLQKQDRYKYGIKKDDVMCAIDFCDKAIAVNPKYGFACLIRARTYLLLNDYPSAHAGFQSIPDDNFLNKEGRNQFNAYKTIAEILSKKTVTLSDEVKLEETVVGSGYNRIVTKEDAGKLLHAANELIAGKGGRFGFLNTPLSLETLLRVLIVTSTLLNPPNPSEVQLMNRIAESLTYKPISLDKQISDLTKINKSSIKPYIENNCRQLMAYLYGNTEDEQTIELDGFVKQTSQRASR